MKFLNRVMAWATVGLMLFLFILLAPILFPLAGLCYLLSVVTRRMGGKLQVWGLKLQAYAKELE